MTNISYLSIILLLLIFELPATGAKTSKTRWQIKNENQIHLIRKMVVGRSLLVRWKLAQDDNFRLNAKNKMINSQSNQRKRSVSTQSYFTPSPMPRLGRSFFQAQQPQQQANSIYLHLYQGNYSTNSTIVLQLPLTDSMEKGIKKEKGLTLWQTPKGMFISCMLVQNQKVIGKFNTEAKFEIIINMKNLEEMTSSTKIWLNFYSNSFTFFADLSPVTDQYNNFIYLVVGCCALFLLSVLFLKPRKSVYNLSQWMIVQVVAFIMVANVILFGQGFVMLDTNMWMVSLCALVNIALSLFFMSNYEDVIWNQFNTVKKGLLLCLYLAVYFLLAYNYFNSLVFWIYQGFILFAVQISYAYSKGGRGGMAVKLVLTIAITRIPFIYYRFNMEELTGIKNSPKLLFAFIGINIILLTFIALQRYFGSRFLIPKQLIPDYFNYFQKDIDADSLKETCSICTLPLGQDPDKKQPEINQSNSSHASNQDVTDTEVLQEQKKHVSLMMTPCSHMFHPSCLQDWMEKRLNCPLCRTSLPPSEAQRDDSYCC